jgi:transcription factor SPN1
MSSPSESRPASPSPDGHEPDNDIDDPVGASLAKPTADVDDDLSDNDSILSDVDEAQFEDFDPANVTIDRPAIPVDEGNVKLLGRHKRKRDGEQGDEEGGKKKKKEAKRDRSRKSKKNNDDDDDDFSGGQEVEGKRIRKKKSGAEGGSGARREKARVRKATPEDEELLDPEERKIHILFSPSCQ